MVRLNKTAQLLRYISRKKFCSLSDMTTNSLLLEVYSNTRSTTPQRRIIDACSILAKKGFITVGMLDNEKVFKITEKGRRHLKRIAVLETEITSNIWDERWYIVTFDLAETKKVVRNQIILCLKRQGFFHYTKGLWILPYNPIKLIEELREQYGLKHEIKLIVATHLDGEAKLVRHFKLK